MCEQRGWCCWNILSLRPLVNSLYLIQMESWVRKYHLRSFLLLTRAYGKFWIRCLMMVTSKTRGAHTKFNTGSEIFVIAMNHCLHTKQVLHTGLHDTLHMIQYVISRQQIISWITRECFVTSTWFWAFTKILFANLCFELFRQKFLLQNFVLYSSLSEYFIHLPGILLYIVSFFLLIHLVWPLEISLKQKMTSLMTFQMA